MKRCIIGLELTPAILIQSREITLKAGMNYSAVGNYIQNRICAQFLSKGSSSVLFLDVRYSSPPSNNAFSALKLAKIFHRDKMWQKIKAEIPRTNSNTVRTVHGQKDNNYLDRRSNLAVPSRRSRNLEEGYR